MNICMIFCYSSDILAMQRVLHLPVQLPKKFIKISGLEREGEKITVFLNAALKSKTIALMIGDLIDDQVAIKKITVPLDAPAKVIKDTFDILRFPDSLQGRLKKYSLAELIERAEFLHKYDFPQSTVDSFAIRIEEKQRENVPSIASRIQKEPWRVEKARKSREAILKKRKTLIKFHSPENKTDTITVPLNLIQTNSVVIKSMIDDLMQPEGVMSEDISILLDASSEIMRDIFHTLTFPESLEEKLKNYSLKELIDRDNFLQAYNFTGDITKLFAKMISNYELKNADGEQMIEELNRDKKEQLFISPAMTTLGNVILANHMNDKDRRVELFSGDSIAFEYSLPVQNEPNLSVRGSDSLYSIHSVTFSPDGKKMVSGGGSGLGTRSLAHLLLWSLNNDGSINTVPRSFSVNLKLPDVYAVAFSPNGKNVVSGSYSFDEEKGDDNLFLWTLNNDGSINQSPQALKGHTKGVSSLAFHPIHKNIMISAGDGINSLLLWTFNDDGSINTTPQILKDSSAGGIEHIVISTDGKVMISVTDNDIMLWKFNDGIINTMPIPLKVKEPLEGKFGKAALSFDGKKLVTCFGQKLLLWNLEDINNIANGEIINHFKSWSQDISSIVFSRDNKKIIIQRYPSNQMSLYDIDDSKMNNITLIKCPYYGTFVAMSPDDKKIIASFAKRFMYWNLFKPEEEKLLHDLSEKLTPAQGQLIIRLGKLLQQKKKESLSSFYEKVYNSLPLAVQKLFKDAVSNASIDLRFKKLIEAKKKMYEYFDKPQYQDRQNMIEEIGKLKRIYQTVPRDVSQPYSQALDEVTQEMGY